MHLIHTGRCPSYISNTLQLVADHASRTGLSSASTSRYILPRLRTIFGELDLYTAAVDLDVGHAWIIPAELTDHIRNGHTHCCLHDE